MRRNLIAAAAVLVGGLTAAGTANAQAWLGAGGLANGRGVRVGNFELHPGFGAEFGFDSNTFYRPAGQETPSLRLRLTPSISIATARTAQSTGGPVATNAAGTAAPTGQIANFSANFALIYNHFFGLGVGPNQDLFANVNGLNGLGGQLGFRLHLFPQGTWQFALYSDAARVVQGTPDFGVSLFVFNAIRNVGGFDVIFAPGHGIFDLRLTYNNTLNFIEGSAFQSFSFMGNTVALRNRWRFLPKTALLWEALFTPTIFLTPNNSGTGLFTSFPVTTRFGINGLLTERIGLMLMVGYTGTYFTNGDNADTIVAQGEFRYIINRLSSFQFGLQRDVQPSFIGNFYIRNRAYIQYSHGFTQRFWVSGELSAGIYEYGFPTNMAGMRDPTLVMGPAGILGVDPVSSRFGAMRIAGLVIGEYRFTDWFGINATLGLNTNISEAAIRNAGMTPGMAQALQWTKFEAFIGLRVNL